MPAEPEKLFDLMNTEVEPTDEQLAELMRYVGEAVRAKNGMPRPIAGTGGERLRESGPPSYRT
jgi:hypothetical protein